MVVVRRDTGVKATLQNENLDDQLTKLLDTVHEDMYNRALVERDANMAVTTEWDDFCQLLDQRKIIQAPYCGGEYDRVLDLWPRVNKSSDWK